MSNLVMENTHLKRNCHCTYAIEVGHTSPKFLDNSCNGNHCYISFTTYRF